MHLFNLSFPLFFAYNRSAERDLRKIVNEKSIQSDFSSFENKVGRGFQLRTFLSCLP